MGRSGCEDENTGTDEERNWTVEALDSSAE